MTHIYKYWNGSAVYSESPSPRLSLQAIFFLQTWTFPWILYLDADQTSEPEPHLLHAFINPRENLPLLIELPLSHKLRIMMFFHACYLAKCVAHVDAFATSSTSTSDLAETPGCHWVWAPAKNLHCHISSQSFSCFDSSEANKRLLVSMLPLQGGTNCCCRHLDLWLCSQFATQRSLSGFSLFDQNVNGDTCSHPQPAWQKRRTWIIPHIQGDFFNWPPPEFAKCWPVSNWFQKDVRVPDWPPLMIKIRLSVWRSEYDYNT